MSFQNVLLVEDNQIDAFICMQILIRSGICNQVVHKLNGKDAIDYIAENPINIPEIILLDIRMPEMNGFEFLEALDILPQDTKEKTKVFMLSSSDAPDDIERSKHFSTVVDFLFKPFRNDYINRLTS